MMAKLNSKANSKANAARGTLPTPAPAQPAAPSTPSVSTNPVPSSQTGSDKQGTSNATEPTNPEPAREFERIGRNLRRCKLCKHINRVCEVEIYSDERSCIRCKDLGIDCVSVKRASQNTEAGGNNPEAESDNADNATGSMHQGAVNGFERIGKLVRRCEKCKGLGEDCLVDLFSDERDCLRCKKAGIECVIVKNNVKRGTRKRNHAEMERE